MADHAKNIRVEEKLLLAEYDKLLKICFKRCIGFKRSFVIQTKESRKKYFSILYNKLTSGPARPFFVKNIAGFCFDLSEKNNNASCINIDQNIITKLGFISEVVICIQYYHNQILDEKFGVDTPRKILINRKKANQLKRALYHYVETEFPEAIKNKIFATLHQCFLAVDLGQYLEKKTSTFQFMLSSKNKLVHINEIFNPYIKEVAAVAKEIDLNFEDELFLTDPKGSLIKENIINQIKNYSPSGFKEKPQNDDFYAAIMGFKENLIYSLVPGKEINFILFKYFSNYDHSKSFLNLYFQRIYLTCATLYVSFTDLITELFQLGEDQKSALKKFSIHFGIMRQIVNDNTDCTPSCCNPGTKTKKTIDTFKDLRNNNITLPLFLLLCDSRKNKTKRILKITPNRISTAFCDNRVFKELMDTNSWDTSVKFGQLLVSEQMMTCLDLVHKTEHKKAIKYLCSIAYYNKFYHSIYNYKQYTSSQVIPTPSVSSPSFSGVLTMVLNFFHRTT